MENNLGIWPDLIMTLKMNKTENNDSEHTNSDI